MTTIAILPEQSEDHLTTFSAVTAGRKATGRTAGEALDALTSQLSAEETSAPVVVQQFLPDQLFSAAQRDRLSALMARWRAARESGNALPSAEQAELEKLVDEEVQGSAERAAHILRDLKTTPTRRRYEEMRVEFMARRKQESWRGLLLESASLVAHFVGLLLLVIASALVHASSIYVGIILMACAVKEVISLLLHLDSVNIYLGAEKGRRRGKFAAPSKSLESSTDRDKRREQTKAR